MTVVDAISQIPREMQGVIAFLLIIGCFAFALGGD